MRDIVENGGAVLEYTHNIDFDDFLRQRLIRDASERCLARISEAAVKLGPIAEEFFPSHDWRGMRDFGNVLRHDYEGVLDEATWAIISVYLPPLLVELEKFLAQYPPEQEML